MTAPGSNLTSGVLAPRVLSTGRQSARIALVATTALLLGGDHVEITVDVGSGCRLDLVDTAGTVAYDGRGQLSSWAVSIRVAAGGVLQWKAEPFVVATGAEVTRSTTIDVAHGGVALIRETLVFGRCGETGGGLQTRTRVRYGGVELLAEDLDLSDSARRGRPGVLGGHRVVDTVCLLGGRGAAPDPAGSYRLFQLNGPGTVARWLGSELHDSDLSALVGQWT